MMQPRRATADGQPSFALPVGITVFVVLLVVSRPAWHEGIGWFFRAGDPVFFRAVARSPFGTGHAFRASGFGFEASYRYGRIGFPLAGWLLALGHAAWVEWALVGLHFAAIAAVPALAIKLLEAHGVKGAWGACVLAAPGLLILHDRAYVEPFLVCVILIAFIVNARGYSYAALAVIAYAILVKETAALALLPFAWHAVRVRDRKLLGGVALALVPYIAWSSWVRARVGEFPFLADDPSRRRALGLPFSGAANVLQHHAPDATAVVVVIVATAVFAVVAAYAARDIPLAGATAAFGVLALCAGPETLKYLGETLRLLIVPQVLAIICVVYAVRSRERRRRDVVDTVGA